MTPEPAATALRDVIAAEIVLGPRDRHGMIDAIATADAILASTGMQALRRWAFEVGTVAEQLAADPGFPFDELPASVRDWLCSNDMEPSAP